MREGTSQITRVVTWGINASRVEGLSPYCPPLVATQAPLPGTAADFWLMVHEQKVSVIVMLVSEAEMEKVRGEVGRAPVFSREPTNQRFSFGDNT